MTPSTRTRTPTPIQAVLPGVDVPSAATPVEPELYEAPIGPAAGCLLGLAIAAVMWAAIIGAAWWIWTLVTR